MDRLAELRAEISDAIDPRLVRVIPCRRAYRQNMRFYEDTDRDELIRKGYRCELLDPLLLPIIKRICLPGEYDITPAGLYTADMGIQEAVVSRMSLCREISEIKQERCVPTRDESRELEVIARAVKVGAEVGLDQELVTDCFQIIIENMRIRQDQFRISTGGNPQ